MNLDDYLAERDNEHSQRGNPAVRCNALYKTARTFNCYLTASQAIEFARHLLAKAQLVLDNRIEDAAIQVWNTGQQGETIRLGLAKARKGGRRKISRPAPRSTRGKRRPVAAKPRG
ncbi:MAG: hypothetical protein LLG00_07735 [Planctomycetaceae bacterium]|nr:hypothetical protein [Planctomycetaceae bacterium]